MRIPHLVLAAALGAGCGATSPSTAAEPDGRLAEGQRYYRRYCASCHGFQADGQGPLSAVLRPPPADLRLLAERHGSPLPRHALAEKIDGRKEVTAHGPREMPVWGERLYGDLPPGVASEAVKAGTIWLILDYLETVQRR